MPRCIGRTDNLKNNRPPAGGLYKFKINGADLSDAAMVRRARNAVPLPPRCAIAPKRGGVRAFDEMLALRG